MNNLIDRAANLLYPDDGPVTLDIKFFSGAEQNVSAASLAEQVLRAEAQVQSGSAILVENVDRHLM